MTGPLHQVLAAFQAGARTFDEIAQHSGLPVDLVRVSIEHLIRMRRVNSTTLSAGCPAGGCRSCFSATAEGEPGCGAPAPSDQRTGAALVQLSLANPAN